MAEDYGYLTEQFTDEEKRRLVQHRPPGVPSREYQDLFRKRDGAVEELFRTLSADKPQTKRHCYYMAKAIGLCGADTDRSVNMKTGKATKDKTYFSSIIADIITKACWEHRIKWSSVLDDTRRLNTPLFWEDAATFLESRINIFDIDRAQGQKVRIIVCTEKDAVIESVADICDREHIPSMSFHGQASDGAVYKLARHIYEWKGQCDRVEVAYLGDFDPGGLTINHVVFGDTLELRVQKQEQGEKPDRGKLFRMQTLFFPGSPLVYETRIGITEDDLENSEYDQFIMHASNDKDPNFNNFKNLREGDVRTLGIDILSTEEIEGRLQRFINQYKDEEAWAEREEFFATERAKLEHMINSGLERPRA